MLNRSDTLQQMCKSCRTAYKPVMCAPCGECVQGTKPRPGTATDHATTDTALLPPLCMLICPRRPSPHDA